MSSDMQADTASGRKRRNHEAGADARQASEQTGEAQAASQTVTIEIAGLQVTLPVRFRSGHVLTENQAKVLDSAYQRQFTNNQNANAKARADRFTKATTDAEREANLALTANELAEFYPDYEPAVGGGPRMGSMEKMRSDAAWRAWVQLVKEHNDAVTAGGTAVITKAVDSYGKPKPVAVQTCPRKPRDMSEEAHKVVREEFEQTKALFIDKLLSMPLYAERIQVQLDAILAEKGANKTEAAGDDIVVSGDSLL